MVDKSIKAKTLEETRCWNGNDEGTIIGTIAHRFELWSEREQPEFPEQIVLRCVFCELRKVYKIHEPT